jgi:hypothetical protein
MTKSISDVFFMAGVLVGIVAAGYAGYFVWTMNWGTGSRNMAIGWAFLVFLPLAAFWVSVLLLGMLGSFLESYMARRGR